MICCTPILSIFSIIFSLNPQLILKAYLNHFFYEKELPPIHICLEFHQIWGKGGFDERFDLSLIWWRIWFSLDLLQVWWKDWSSLLLFFFIKFEIQRRIGDVLMLIIRLQELFMGRFFFFVCVFWLRHYLRGKFQFRKKMGHT